MTKASVRYWYLSLVLVYPLLDLQPVQLVVQLIQHQAVLLVCFQEQQQRPVQDHLTGLMAAQSFALCYLDPAVQVSLVA